ncbi:DUF4240 domain-containing protein [Streptomyces tsukubensis]|uniref:DUF4240 domain-containing protein n=1 Tax=Streptomyces tsukubensis TaxID=83656 RepID=UPI003450BD94
MDEKTFWALMDELSRRTGDRAERLSGLREELLRLPAEAVVEFQAHLEAACDAVTMEALLPAVMRIESGLCSDDGFEYFTRWLVAQGRQTYEAVLADPDALADIPGVRALAGRDIRVWRDDEWPEWEELSYVAKEAFDALAGEDEEAFHEALEALQEGRDEPGETEVVAAQETPRLNALFPVRARA